MICEKTGCIIYRDFRIIGIVYDDKNYAHLNQTGVDVIFEVDSLTYKEQIDAWYSNLIKSATDEYIRSTGGEPA